MKSLAIVGAGGHGGVVADIASQSGFKLIDFYDDSKSIGTMVGTWIVKGCVKDLLQQQDNYAGIFVAIGHNEMRSILNEKIDPEKQITLIHPQAVVSTFANIGSGTVVMPGAIINAFAKIENGVIINSAAVIEHDCQVGNYAHVSPGAILAGNVTVGEYSWLGANCSIRQEISVGANAVVGMGAVVVENVKQATTVVGIPAKELSE
ncbi:Trimeric LpxA-like family protein [Vibrio orientalis CIP 102891 = ATCC 33934]|uniref:Pilin glycosylation protein n=1 Tax=Vibrio orientalis CIP 102891 = ATCC 33934 TaxID=675816 RepID=C9QDF4_VIBOR|nr:acetyltransferase [Vibrio orientalis]EEX95056.1 pilin glycosylation protein [Vibrio orientalis CIP 102891 = ATCC 33934]EGU52117.1 Trimeric LpxA-like family protein [Vibrio orientalis CIP 102891 = ATCC 33934]